MIVRIIVDVFMIIGILNIFFGILRRSFNKNEFKSIHALKKVLIGGFIPVLIGTAVWSFNYNKINFGISIIALIIVIYFVTPFLVSKIGRYLYTVNRGNDDV